MVLGAVGRCGRGACDLFAAVGLETTDIQETRTPGPYKTIVEHDIFLNAIYLSEPIPPFINQELLAQPGRKLGVVCDVSCDTTNPHNPLPIYSINTTFDEPTVPVVVENDQNKTPLSVISIDHIPSMLPRESSVSFSDGLREALLQLHQKDTYRVWTDAAKLFNEKVAELPEALRAKEA
uniref:Alanine dehydrogenase/pyridine nucleotide transhydrogenase NAD(H)-binding domain-containing protein n=1 Tax=Bionectria ochroleuca TaxID=29856 RepID=A0A8H7NPS0_BIOOC